MVVEISGSANFSAGSFLVRDAVPAIIERYVRATPLPLAPDAPRATYYWRVGRPSAGAVVWSRTRSIRLEMPARQVSIPGTAGWAAVQGLLAAAAAASSAASPSLVRFDDWGNRTLAPPPQAGAGGPNPPAFISLSSVTDLIVDGGGTTITFSDYVQFVELLNCSRVQIVNFGFDLLPLPYTALAIDAVDTASSTATMRLQPGHPPVEALLSSEQLESTGIAEVMTVAPMHQPGSSPAPRTMRGVPEEIAFQNVTRVAQRAGDGPWGGAPRYNMTLAWHGGNPLLPRVSGVERLSEGDFIVIDPRIDIGFNVMGGEAVTLRGVQVFACANECFNSEHAERLAILQCGTRLRPGRFLGANNGGHNHHGAAVGQWVEGGTWENAGDDTIHVSGLVMSVLAVGGSGQPPNSLTLAPSYPDNYALRVPMFHHSLGVRSGDVLQFFDPTRGAMLGTRTVLALRDASDANPTVGVTLDGPVPPNVTPGRIGGGVFNHTVTNVFNFNRTSNQFVFRGNAVRNGRRAGVLYKGFRSWVGSNTFEGLGGGALELWNAPYEGLFAQTVLFRGNTVTDVCQLSRAAAPVWTSVIRPRGASQPRLAHSDLRIENNTFDTGPGPILWLTDIRDAVITANAITYCPKAAVYPSGGVLNTSNARGVDLRGDNTLHAVDSPRLCVK
eukprot:g7726.t1